MAYLEYSVNNSVCTLIRSTYMLPTSLSGANIGSIDSPTFTLAPSTGPSNTSIAAVVTSLGGTQSSVGAQTVDDPYIITFTWPQAFKTLEGKLSLLGGFFRGVPVNRCTLQTSKGTKVNALGGRALSSIRTDYSLVTGASAMTPQEFASAMSLHHAAQEDAAQEIYDALVLGIAPSVG